MGGVTDIDPWTLYTDTRDRLIALVRPLTAGQARQPVALTPGWTIADVVAHVCGLNADVAAGMREGLGTDERTAHQVETRAGQTVGEMCDEWLGHADAMGQAISDNRYFGLRLAADLVVHLHDVQHTLGEPIDREDEATISGGRTYAARTPERLAEATGVTMMIELSDGTTYGPSGDGASPSGSPGLVLRATPYDFLRSVTGRRSRAQVQAMDWSADPSPVLDHFSPYGPLRSIDADI